VLEQRQLWWTGVVIVWVQNLKLLAAEVVYTVLHDYLNARHNDQFKRNKLLSWLDSVEELWVKGDNYDERNSTRIGCRFRLCIYIWYRNSTSRHDDGCVEQTFSILLTFTNIADRVHPELIGLDQNENIKY